VGENKYDDLTAAQALGYASNLCSAQVTLSQVQAKGVVSPAVNNRDLIMP
jgi:hypothetical protein